MRAKIVIAHLGAVARTAAGRIADVNVIAIVCWILNVTESSWTKATVRIKWDREASAANPSPSEAQ